MNSKLSIIVPIYNVEKYLSKCIDSLINQTYKNLEIILVDDGSTDLSGTIANNYAKKDSRVKVFHKKNGGLADARNYGLLKSTGKYLAFIDSDDWIDTNAYEYSITMMLKNNCDMFVFNSINCYSDSAPVINNSNNFIVIENKNLFNRWDIIGRGVCDKIFLREYWNDIRFPLGKTSEDIFVIYKLMAKAQKTLLSSNIYYFYRQRHGSITKVRQVRIDPYEAYLEVKKFIKENYPQSYYVFMKNFVTNCMGIYNSIILFEKDNKYKNIIYSEIKNNSRYIMLNNNVNFIKKIQLLMLLYFPKAYYVIIKRKYNIEEKKLYF